LEGVGKGSAFLLRDEPSLIIVAADPREVTQGPVGSRRKRKSGGLGTYGAKRFGEYRIHHLVGGFCAAQRGHQRQQTADAVLQTDF
jgi:hypothetical protein